MAMPDKTRREMPSKPEAMFAEVQMPELPSGRPAEGPSAEMEWKAIERRCNAKEIQACFDLAQMYWEGRVTGRCEEGKGMTEFRNALAIDKEQARASQQSACDAGNASGCFSLGLMYENGEGVVQDRAKAVATYQKACEAGNANGCNNLGRMLEHGEGVAQNKAQAVALYQKACDAGNAWGCNNLGWMLERGESVAQDTAKAAVLYQKACDFGIALACNNLGLMYANGTGAARDKAQAVALYQKACDAGNAWGCNNLGWMLEHGEGVAQDTAKAAALYQKACNAEIALACNNLRLMKDNRVSLTKDKPAEARGVEPSNSTRTNQGGAHPGDFQERHGDWLGVFNFAVGAVYAKVGSPGARAENGVVRSTLLMRLVMELTPDLLVGGEFQGLMMNMLDSAPYLSNVSATAIYYPVTTSNWYTRAGTGLLIYKETQDKTAVYGASVILGTGYDYRVLRHVGLGVEANYTVGRASGATCQTLGGFGVMSFYF
jgi:hypothetical protein